MVVRTLMKHFTSSQIGSKHILGRTIQGFWRLRINMTRLVCLIAGNVLGGEVNTSKFSDRLEREKLTRTAGQPILLLLLAVSVHISFENQVEIGGLIVNCNQRVWEREQGTKSSKIR